MLRIIAFGYLKGRKVKHKFYTTYKMTICGVYLGEETDWGWDQKGLNERPLCKACARTEIVDDCRLVGPGPPRVAPCQPAGHPSSAS